MSQHGREAVKTSMEAQLETMDEPKRQDAIRKA